MSAKRTRVLAATMLAAVACGSDAPPTPTNADPHTNAIAYLDSAITIMQNRAFYRRRVKWDSVRTNARAQAAGAISPAETHSAIRQALLALGDRHSFLLSAATSSLASSTPSAAPVDSLTADFLDGRFGFVHIPTFSQLVPGSSSTGLADTLQALIRSVDARDPCAWIVDLRHNRGGNMWPMLAGVGPILGNDDRAGAFVDADSNITTWYYQNGASGTISQSGQRSISAQVSRAPYVLRRPSPPVAVLTDSLTASSGEAIVVAFKGLSRARSFGGATAGVPTANAGFPLRDGATLFLMVALDADRNGTWYSTRIPADESISLAARPQTDDAIVTAAKNWLRTRGTCPST